MSVTAFEHEYSAAPKGRPLRARPLGSLAATGIGAGALAVLLCFVAFSGKAPAPAAAPEENEPQALFAPRAPDALARIAETGAASGVKQFAAFDIAPPEFAKEKKTVAARRLDPQGGREENFTFGQFGASDAFMRLDVLLPGGGKLGNSDFFLDLTRHAAQAGLSVGKIGQPSALPTRFGSFEAADIRLTKSGGDAASERSCLAVRMINPKLPLEVAGVACGTAAKPVDRRAMACILDRLDYLSNGENKALDAFFLNAELGRGQGCAGASLSPNTEKASWIDAHSSAPALKTGVAAPAKPAKAKAAPAKAKAEH